MAKERTLSIIKPDAVRKNLVGEIETCIEKAGLLIVAAKMLRMSRVQAGDFYEIHQGKSFYEDLVEFMTSGPVIVQVLEAEDAISRYREVMGPTTFGEARPGTIRAKYATSTTRNAVHGSDCKKNAKREIKFFFAEHEIFSRG
ncbi:MAG: nucleoside-diphosphate kinase [Gammaproteobacteria bacterium]|nr:nucleoside-diphosphate kinase [Gammaproteobacteria bacterium]